MTTFFSLRKPTTEFPNFPDFLPNAMKKSHFSAQNGKPDTMPLKKKI